jgi:uncharacterized RDD family membrane protein YckC
MMNSMAIDEFASVRERFCAAVIDALLLALVSVVFISLTGQYGFAMSIIFGAVYHWYWWTRFTGQTPGKKIMNIRIVKANGKEIDDIDAVTRYFAAWLGLVTVGLGWWMMTNDSQRQALHDKIAGTIVIKNY